MKNNHPLHIAWLIAIAAMLGSLFFSEILKLPPCDLCWWQRILAYPLAVIIPVGIINCDRKIYRHVLPFSIIGMVVAFYHYLLYIGIIPERLSPCSNGVSCTQKLIEFGPLNIPLLSFFAFTIITAMMFYYRESNRGKEIINE